MTNDRPPQNVPQNAPDWEAIARHLAGEDTPDDRARMDRWLDAHPKDRDIVERLDAALSAGVNAAAAPASADDVDVEAALRRVRARMDADVDAPRGRPGIIPLFAGRRNRAAWFALAAAAAVIAAVAITMQATSRRARRGTPLASAAPARTYATAIGQQDSVTLSDGTHIVLGPASRLAVPADYGAGDRQVDFSGDGYFDVHHDAAHPFTVRMAHAVVEDIGTVFTIESDAADTTSVSVISGAVRLRAAAAAGSRGALLAAGDRGAVGTAGDVQAYHHGARADDAAWTSGRLVFHDASLARVAGELHRWYGVDLRFADAALPQHLTADFGGESIDQVLNILSLDLRARLVRAGDTVTVYSTGGSATKR
jgi:transmembrane sensor